MNTKKLSLIIPAKDKNDPKLQELLRSIEAQDFPKEEMEVLVITEGTSESAKAIGIRRAKGEVIGILASDNELIGETSLTNLYEKCLSHGASQPLWYYHNFKDNPLNRYFALIGGNDPLAYYIGKNDKACMDDGVNSDFRNRTLGDNGFFIKKSLIMKTDLDNYYHIDNAVEALEDHPCLISVINGQYIWHKTGGNILTFFKKRYRYGLQHAFNKNRRWHLVDFTRKEDICRLAWFIVASLTILHPLSTSIRGYLKVRDLAWFLHPIACLLTLFTYGVLVIHFGLNRMSQSLFAPMDAQKA